MRLLAVDDDPLILDLLPVVFRQANLPQISVATSGEAALELLSEPETEIDGLILDIEMPKMNGIELCRTLRQMPRYRHKPILMLTSAKDSTRIERAFAAGADDYITKPFDVKEIATRVRVAERMTQKSIRAPLLDPSAIAAGGPEGQHSFELNDPVRIAGAGELILPFALGNYLSQLSRCSLDTCNIFAVHIADIDLIYASTTSREFATVLKAGTDAIVKVLNSPNLLMAYEGDGMFLCIVQGVEPPAWPDVEIDVQDALKASGLTYDDGRKMHVKLSVGNPITPNASRNQRVKKTFDRARDRAMSRERSKIKQDGSIGVGSRGPF